MQEFEINDIIDSLKTYFPQVEEVEDKIEGFRDHECYCYVRAESPEFTYPFRIEDDWMLGDYVVIAEDSTGELTSSELAKIVMAKVSSTASAPEIKGVSINANKIYRDETGEDLQQVSNICKVAFRVRSEYICFSC